jgi:hypothetical protein
MPQVPEVHDGVVGQPHSHGRGQGPVCGDGQATGAKVVPEEVVRLGVASLDERVKGREVTEA